MTLLVPHFSVEEMACKCCGRCQMDVDFMEMLEHYRLDLDMPLRITSGYRCEEHNAKVGGKSGSQHLIGHAADIDWRDFDAARRHHMVKTAMEHGFNGIGIAKDFLHLDDRLRSEALWTY